MSKQQILTDATAMFREYIGNGPIMPSTQDRLVYPQRVSFQGGSFALEGLEAGRIVAIPMSEIVADWESAD